MKILGAKPSIRFSLIVLVLACLIPAGLAQAGLAYYSFKAQRQQLLNDTLVRVRALTAALDREMIAAEGGRQSPGHLARAIDRGLRDLLPPGQGGADTAKGRQRGSELA